MLSTFTVSLKALRVYWPSFPFVNGKKRRSKLILLPNISQVINMEMPFGFLAKFGKAIKFLQKNIPSSKGSLMEASYENLYRIIAPKLNV